MPLSPMSSRISLSIPRNLMTALSETKEAVKGLSFNVTTRGLVSTWTGGCFTLNSATFVSHTINRSILSVKVSGKPVEERVKHSDKEKDVFRLVTSVGQRKKFWVPMRNRTSDLRISCSDALPLSSSNCGERGLLRSLYDTRPANCLDQQCR